MARISVNGTRIGHTASGNYLSIMSFGIEKQSAAQNRELADNDLGLEEQEIVAATPAEGADVTYLYKGTYHKLRWCCLGADQDIAPENTNGEVIEKFLIPSPSADPADPLV